jgi:hypothetical protein
VARIEVAATTTSLVPGAILRHAPPVRGYRARTPVSQDRRHLVSTPETKSTPPSAEDRRGLLDFLVTQEQFGVVAVGEAIKRAPGTPSETFLPVLRNTVTAEYHHAVALEALGATALTTRFWIPDAAFGEGGPGLFAAIEAIETIEVSMYGVGVDAFARTSDPDAARLCAQALGVEAVHRALARFAKGQLGGKAEVPNDVGFENYDWPSIAKVRTALEGLGIGYGVEGVGPGKFYDYEGDPVASGVGAPVTHTMPA